MWTSRKALHKFFYTRTASLFMQSPAILKNLLWPLPMKWGGWNSGTTMTKCSFTTNCLWLRRTSNASRLTPEVGGGSDLWLDTQTWHTWYSVTTQCPTVSLWAGLLLAVGTDTGTVHILDFSGQTETLQSLRCTQDSIHLISFSDDSMYLATAVGKLNFFGRWQ